MHPIPDDEFERFAAQRKRDLQRIARHTGGEHQLADVVHEAWIMAWSLRMPDGEPLNLATTACQEKLLSHLYQHLVRYTEQNVRRAVRLDHAPPGRGQDDDAHPLTYLRVGNEGHDPLSEMIEQEAASALDTALNAHGSLAATYVRFNLRSISTTNCPSNQHADGALPDSIMTWMHARPVPASPVVLKRNVPSGRSQGMKRLQRRS